MEGIASTVDECTSQEVPGSSNDSQDTRTVRETETAKKPVYSRKRNIQSLASLVNKVKAVGEMVQTTTANNHSEFGIFGCSVAAQLNAMPIMIALQAQSHIQNYLTNLRIHCIANPLNLQAYSPSPPSSTTYISSPEPPTTVNQQAYYSPPEESPQTYEIHLTEDTNSSLSGPSSVINVEPEGQSNAEESNILQLAINSLINE